MRARVIRADFTFGEQIIDIADDSRNDWVKTKTGRLIPNKELVLRSKIRIAARQLHMSRLQPQTRGDKLIVGIKNDGNLLSETSAAAAPKNSSPRSRQSKPRLNYRRPWKKRLRS